MKPPTKAQTLGLIAEKSDMKKADVVRVMDAMINVIKTSLNKYSEFNLHGLIKIRLVRKPATKARMGVPNPFKPGETMNIKAKDARNDVKVRALKGLKDLAAK